MAYLAAVLTVTIVVTIPISPVGAGLPFFNGYTPMFPSVTYLLRVQNEI